MIVMLIEYIMKSSRFLSRDSPTQIIFKHWNLPCRCWGRGKSFAQVNVLTLDGKVQTGVRISEDDKTIVLRSFAQPKPISIDQDDVDDVIESKVSLMPANLARQLKSRKEFNDLMKYVIEIRKR